MLPSQPPTFQASTRREASAMTAMTTASQTTVAAVPDNTEHVAPSIDTPGRIHTVYFLNGVMRYGQSLPTPDQAAEVRGHKCDACGRRAVIHVAIECSVSGQSLHVEGYFCSRSHVSVPMEKGATPVVTSIYALEDPAPEPYTPPRKI
jgi:hypothetical protein